VFLALSSASNGGNGVAQDPVNNIFVAVGVTVPNTVNIARSIDGITWTAISSVFGVKGNGVAYAPQQQRWVAVGEGSFQIA
jgi:hypothetical protein